MPYYQTVGKLGIALTAPTMEVCCGSHGRRCVRNTSTYYYISTMFESLDYAPTTKVALCVDRFKLPGVQ